jgi:hypothetical protein
VERRSVSRRSRRRAVVALAAASLAVASAAYATGVLPRSGVDPPASPSAPRRDASPAIRALRITVSPGTLNVSPGTSTTAEICVRGGRGSRPIRLRALVDSAIATFDPARVANRGCATLTLVPSDDAAAGTHDVHIRARQRGRRRVRRGTATASLVIDGAPSPTPTPSPSPPGPTSPPPTVTEFSIAGSAADPVLPGGPPSVVDLRFTNPTSTTLHVTDARIVVVRTSVGATCPPSNFVTTPFAFGTAGSGGVPVPPGATVALEDAGVDASLWPTIAMVDDGDQDPCKNASIELEFTGGLAYS